VIASEHVQRIFELNLQGEDEGQHLDRKASSVHIISKEEVLGRLQWSSCIIVYDFDEIVKLSVDVSHNGYGILYLDDVGLKFFIVCASTEDALGFFEEF
jgi:hypothetical protein